MRTSKKNTVALIRAQGESSAYLAASGASIIFASPFSKVGDIGITSSFTDNAKANDANGVTFNHLSLGKYKDMGNSDSSVTQEEKDLMMKNDVQPMYDAFVSIVAKNRHLDLTSTRKLANGMGVAGEVALKEGLVDRLGGFLEVEAYLKSKGISCESSAGCFSFFE